MARRRAYRQGSIFQDSKGQWWAKIPLGDGRTRRARCADRKDAERTLKQWLSDRDEYRVDLHGSQQSVKTWLETWLTIKRDEVKPTTLEFYTRHAAYAVPIIGDIRLEALATSHLRQMLGTLKAAGLSPQSCAHVLSVIKNALNMAKTDKKVRENVAEDVKPPTVPQYQAHVLTDDEIDRLLAYVDGEVTGQPERLRALVHLWVALGPRKGEALQARWPDYNREARELVIKDSKTEAGKRVLPLTDELCYLLDLHWQNQQEERRIRGVKWKEHGLIFASEVGTPIGESNLHRLFKRILRDAGLPHDIRIHDLRHTAATELIAAGGDPKSVQDVMGHASVETTLKIYAKSRDEKKRAAVEGAASKRRKKTG